MFYCEDCRKERNWPEGLGRSSYGRCECCDKPAPCYDVPSRLLPLPTKSGLPAREPVVNFRAFNGQEYYVEIRAKYISEEGLSVTDLLCEMFGKHAVNKGGKMRLIANNEKGYYLFRTDIDLRAENGVHTLTRLSPFDSTNKRHTSSVDFLCYPAVNGNTLYANTYFLSKLNVKFGFSEETVKRYFLFPYKRVANMRTKEDTENVEAVLDGDFSSFKPI